MYEQSQCKLQTGSALLAATALAFAHEALLGAGMLVGLSNPDPRPSNVHALQRILFTLCPVRCAHSALLQRALQVNPSIP